MNGNFKYLPLLGLITIGFISHYEWFNFNSILTHGDWLYRTDQHTKLLYKLWSTWIAFSNFGSPNITIFSYPLRGLLWPTIANLGLSYDAAVRLTLMIPIALLGFISPYICFKYLSKNKLVSITVAIFYATTTYFIRRQTNHLPIAFIYSLSPLIFYFFLKSLKSNSKLNWIVTIILLFLGISYDIRIMFIVFIMLGIYAALEFRTKIYVLKGNIIQSGILLLLLSSYWILPTVFGDINKDISSVSSRELFGNYLFDLPHAITIFDYSWTGNLPDQNFIQQPVQLYFWIIPILSLIPLFIWNYYSKLEKHLVLYFALISIFGVLLSKQSSEPFPQLYLWLYTHIPGFSLFREASKYFLITSFGYAGLITYMLIGANRIIQNSILNKYKYLFVVFLNVLFLYNLYPLVTKDIGTLFIPRHIPQEYLDLNTKIQNDHEYYRVLFTPRDSKWSLYDEIHPKISDVDIINSFWNNIYGTMYSSDDWPKQDQIAKIYNQNYTDNILDQTSVKYIVVPLQDASNDDDFFKYYGGNREFYVNLLKSKGYLNQITSTDNRLTIFENQNYKGNIYSIDKLYLVDNLDNIDNKYNFVKKTNQSDFFFMLNDHGLYSNLNVFTLNELFANLKPSDIQDSITQVINNNSRKNRLYTNKSSTEVAYRFKNSFLEIFTTTPDSLYVNNSLIGSDDSSILYQKELNMRNLRYYIKINGELIELNENSNKLLGNETTISKIEILSSDKNAKNNNLNSLDTIKLNNQALFNKITLEDNSNYTFSFINENTNSTNVFPNGSFEEGLWEPNVNDCNNYDGKANLNMSLDQIIKTNGLQSLKLTANKHIACTKRTIKVNPDTLYLFSFDYQSFDSDKAGFYISFNNPEATHLRQELPIESKDWHSFQTQFLVPHEATELSIFVYGFSFDNENTVTTRYDNFSFINLPNITNKYFLVGEPQGMFKKPGEVSYEILGPTKKLVHIKSAVTPFFLVMNDSFHSKWQLFMNDSKITNILGNLTPFAKTDAVPDEQHLKINNYLNGWFVDTNAFCKNKNLCKQNPDGSYDMEMVIEFWPQRWFYLGLIISGTTLLGCLIYLSYNFLNQIRSRKVH